MEFSNNYMPSSTNPEYRIRHHVDSVIKPVHMENSDSRCDKKGNEDVTNSESLNPPVAETGCEMNASDTLHKSVDVEDTGAIWRPKQTDDENEIKKDHSENNEMEILPQDVEPVTLIKVEGENPEEMISSHFLEPQCAISEDDDVILDQSTNFNRKLRKRKIERPYKCHVCEDVFKSSKRLNSHIMLKHSGEKPFACIECDYKSNKDVNLKRHMLTHTGEKKFRCKECGSRFVSKKSLARHIMIHTGERPHSCPECDYTCIQKETLAKHMRTHTGERPYKCSQCTLAFKANGDLSRHMLVHTGEKPLGCALCDYRTNKEMNLKRHVLTHTGEKPFACPYCEYRCTENRVLTKHIMGHTGEKPFACPYCTYRCKENRLLKKHVMCHYCPHCEYRSAEKKLVKEHVKSHMHDEGRMEEKPFACPYCKYRCSEDGQLKKHVMGHYCPYCGYRCNEKKVLKEHVKGHMYADGTFPEKVIPNLPSFN